MDSLCPGQEQHLGALARKLQRPAILDLVDGEAVADQLVQLRPEFGVHQRLCSGCGASHQGGIRPDIPAIRCRRLIEILTALRGIAMGEAWDESPAALCDFLAAGDPPVYIGFGSMPDSKPQATTRLFIDAVQQRGDHQSTGGRI